MATTIVLPSEMPSTVKLVSGSDVVPNNVGVCPIVCPIAGERIRAELPNIQNGELSVSSLFPELIASLAVILFDEALESWTLTNSTVCAPPVTSSVKRVPSVDDSRVISVPWA